MDIRVRRLPSEYQEVEYINNGSTGYIVTNFYPSGTDKIYVKASTTGSLTANQAVFGNYHDGSSTQDFVGYFGKDHFYIWRNGVQQNFVAKPQANVIYEFTADYLNGLAIVKGDSVDETITFTPTTFTCSHKLPIGCRYNASYGGIFAYNLYSVKYYRNNELIGDFIPAKKLSNNEYGLYDLVSKTFFGNQGSGSFTGGAVIHTTDKITIPQGEVAVIRQNNQKIWQRVPWEYEEVEYILPTERGAWIDTNFYPTDKCKVEIAYIPSSTTTVFETVIGCQTSGTAGDNRFYILLSATHYYLQLNHNSSDGHFTGLNANGTSLDNSNGNISQYKELTKIVLDSKNQTWSVKSDHYNTHGVLLGTHKSITSTAQTMSLFGRKTAGAVPVANAFTGKMYYCKIWDDDILVRYFVPCKKGNVYGMFDLVSNMFFANKGTNAFSGGNIK